MKNLLILYGGQGFEDFASFSSFNYVASNINSFNLNSFNMIDILISENNIWSFKGKECYLIKEGSDVFLKSDDFSCKIDIAWAMIPGKGSEDGSLHGLFESFNLPYIGSSVAASVLAYDKLLSNLMVHHCGFKVPEFASYNENFDYCYYSKFLTCEKLIIKPNNSGSSLGISIAFDDFSFKKGIDIALKYSQSLIIQKFIEKKHEILCSVLQSGNEYKAFGIEAVYDDLIFSRECKYEKGKKKFEFPEIIHKVESLALDIFKILKCKDLARLDFVVDQNDEIYFIEINTMPGMSSNSSFIKAMENKGMNSEDFVNFILKDKL